MQQTTWQPPAGWQSRPICVLGGGVLGRRIAACFVAAGYQPFGRFIWRSTMANAYFPRGIAKGRRYSVSRSVGQRHHFYPWLAPSPKP
ncbi:hypothetical protein V1527DRAFT_475756 [Lipomyces starkeyi]